MLVMAAVIMMLVAVVMKGLAVARVMIDRVTVRVM
jgi:hypothetical protein